jgi:hypothetical protein
MEHNYNFGPVTVNINLVDAGPELLFEPCELYHLRALRPKALRGLRTVYKLPDDTGARFKVRGKTRRGNVSDFKADQYTAQTSDPDVLTVSVEADGRLRVEPVGPAGTAQVQVTANDVDPNTEGDQPVHGVLDIEVVPGLVSGLDIQPDETFPVEL